MSANPLEQFRIITLIKLPSVVGYNVDFTNASLYMCLAFLFISAFCLFGLRKRSLVPGGLQSIVEIAYEFIASLLGSNIGKRGLDYIPIVFTIFMFVLTANLLGMLPLPYSFTVTSHLAVTFALSMLVFLMTTIEGFRHHGLKFLRLFLPSGTPLWLAPMMILIELFAYLARPVSLSIRLAANMIAGHTIIKVIAGFVMHMNVFFASVPFIFIMLLIAFEIFVAALQAYIFTVLTCVYLSDSVNGH